MVRLSPKMGIRACLKGDPSLELFVGSVWKICDGKDSPPLLCIILTPFLHLMQMQTILLLENHHLLNNLPPLHKLMIMCRPF
jgi:hypothetical protein